MTPWEKCVAVVTGGASGIGRALSLGAAERGARVAVADVELDRAESVAAEIKARGGRAMPFLCDVADAAQVNDLARRVRQEFGGANLIFNNAGVVAGGTLEQTSGEDAAWLLSVNVMGVFHGVKAFLPLLREAQAEGRPAHIINTGSENSIGVPVLGPNSVYTATKHALLGLTDALRRDLEGSGILVTLLCPGLVATEVFDAGRNRPDDFGGPKTIPVEHAKRIRAMMAERGQDPALTAQLCFEAIDRGDFLVITDPEVRGFATKRSHEVDAALNWIDLRLA